MEKENEQKQEKEFLSFDFKWLVDDIKAMPPDEKAKLIIEMILVGIIVGGSFWGLKEINDSLRKCEIEYHDGTHMSNVPVDKAIEIWNEEIDKVEKNRWDMDRFFAIKTFNCTYRW